MGILIVIILSITQLIIGFIGRWSGFCNLILKFIAIGLIFIAITLIPKNSPAYDDEEATQKYIHCLVKAQKRIHDFDGIGLLPYCQRESYEFMRYNCPGNYAACSNKARFVALLVAKKVK